MKRTDIEVKQIERREREKRDEMIIHLKENSRHKYHDGYMSAE